MAWKLEVSKKPSSMTAADALKVLGNFKRFYLVLSNIYDLIPFITGLPQGDHDESKIRKAYFKMAQNYHPDKNPNGRDMFEKVNSAYEFLCSKSNKCNDAVNNKFSVKLFFEFTINFLV